MTTNKLTSQIISLLRLRSDGIHNIHQDYDIDKEIFTLKSSRRGGYEFTITWTKLGHYHIEDESGFRVTGVFSKNNLRDIYTEMTLNPDVFTDFKEYNTDERELGVLVNSLSYHIRHIYEAHQDSKW